MAMEAGNSRAKSIMSWHDGRPGPLGPMMRRITWISAERNKALNDTCIISQSIRAAGQLVPCDYNVQPLSYYFVAIRGGNLASVPRKFLSCPTIKKIQSRT